MFTLVIRTHDGNFVDSFDFGAFPSDSQTLYDLVFPVIDEYFPCLALFYYNGRLFYFQCLGG